MDSPVKNTGVDCHSLLQRNFPTQESNPGLLRGRQILYRFSYREVTIGMKAKSLSRVQLFVTPWTVAHQASLSMEFSRQEYWSGLPFPSPEELPNPGTEPWSPASQMLYRLSYS